LLDLQLPDLQLPDLQLLDLQLLDLNGGAAAPSAYLPAL
jgi:hypothetical protein